MNSEGTDEYEGAGVGVGVGGSESAHENKRESEYEEAKKCAHRILKARDKTSFELGKRLREKGHSQEAAQRVVARFVEVGLVDDERYTEMFLRSAKVSGKGWYRITRELEQKGIDTKDLTPPDTEEELERACAVIERLTISTYKERDRALRRLVSRGFSYTVAKRAVDLNWTGETANID